MIAGKVREISLIDMAFLAIGALDRFCMARGTKRIFVRKPCSTTLPPRGKEHMAKLADFLDEEMMTGALPKAAQPMLKLMIPHLSHIESASRIWTARLRAVRRKTQTPGG